MTPTPAPPPPEPPRHPLSLPLDLRAAAIFARLWTGPLSDEGDDFFRPLDDRIVAALQTGDAAALRTALVEVQGWAEDQQRDLRGFDDGADEYDELLEILRPALTPPDEAPS